MKSTSILIAGLLVMVLALSACGPMTVAAAQAQPPQRTLSVTGSGTVMMVPDIAYINIGVHTEDTTAASAVSKNNTQTQQVVDALTSAGVDKKDIQTTNFSIWPNAQYDPQTNVKTGTTYAVDNTVYVTVRNLDKLGDLLDTTVQAGANSVNSIQFDVADKSQELKQARDQAIKDAQTQAQELATTAGLTLGSIQTISFFDNVPTPVMDTFGKGGGGGAVAQAASVPISSGQMTLTVTVNVTYELK
ncbi:MAG TPA: SIMPL domain-containing protein [Anaerolineales bacterium]|nr:SIMPL domain-containing protein [Anaerolineales bacterium]